MWLDTFAKRLRENLFPTTFLWPPFVCCSFCSCFLDFSSFVLFPQQDPNSHSFHLKKKKRNIFIASDCCWRHFEFPSVETVEVLRLKVCANEILFPIFRLYWANTTPEWVNYLISSDWFTDIKLSLEQSESDRREKQKSKAIISRVISV